MQIELFASFYEYPILTDNIKVIFNFFSYHKNNILRTTYTQCFKNYIYVPLFQQEIPKGKIVAAKVFVHFQFYAH